MAGFVGIFGQHVAASQANVRDALEATIYSQKTIAHNLQNDQHLILGKSEFTFLDTTRMHAQDENRHAWISGEIFNERELTGGKHQVFADVLLEHYRIGTLDQLLPKVNGVYVAIIFDAGKQTLKIITDRYGLRPIYVYHSARCLIIAAEVKCFSFFDQFTVKINNGVINCFMQLEHFLGNETWFEGVEIAAPATIYTYSLSDDQFTSKRYWSWASIKLSKQSIDEAAEEMAALLDASIKTRFKAGGQVGIALSGGLDSRALVAAVHSEKPVTYTFGTSGSKDVKIARKVASLAGVRHVHYDTYSENWLLERFGGVWKTDGMLNMFHMHYSHLMNEIPRIMDINLSGFLGDAVLGGTYLEKKGKIFLNQRMNQSIARHYYGEHFERCDPEDSFFDLDKVDPYLFYNRGRRMIGMGAEEAAKTVPQRLPFMDIKLMDLSFSLPDEFRAHSKVYNRALLLKYPTFYKDIPHATTGVSIQNNSTFGNTALKRINRLLWIARYKLGLQTSYVNVHNWIKEPATAAFLTQMLDPGNAIYPNFTADNYLKKFLLPHLHGKNNFAKQIMGALTLEVWLQQVLNRKFIPDFKKHTLG
jgi:asparagine synthase (glutamine-hydrolysing)